MPAATAKPGARLRVTLPRGGGRLMRKEAAVRVLLEVARQLSLRISLESAAAEAGTSDGMRLKPPLNR
jgi:hypothetical protein